MCGKSVAKARIVRRMFSVYEIEENNNRNLSTEIRNISIGLNCRTLLQFCSYPRVAAEVAECRPIKKKQGGNDVVHERLRQFSLSCLQSFYCFISSIVTEMSKSVLIK